MSSELDPIIKDAYYLISLFNKENIEIDNLKLQKLMYFFEAYYMYKKDVDSLYDCPFKAWTYGPVAIPLYEEFKRFGKSPIVLDEYEKIQGDMIDDEKKNYLKNIYEAFKDLTSMQLVALTHMSGSPWDKKWKENNEKIVYQGDAGNIDKIETKLWFKDKFIKK